VCQHTELYPQAAGWQKMPARTRARYSSQLRCPAGEGSIPSPCGNDGRLALMIRSSRQKAAICRRLLGLQVVAEHSRVGKPAIPTQSVPLHYLLKRIHDPLQVLVWLTSTFKLKKSPHTLFNFVHATCPCSDTMAGLLPVPPSSCSCITYNSARASPQSLRETVLEWRTQHPRRCAHLAQSGTAQRVPPPCDRQRPLEMAPLEQSGCLQRAPPPCDLQHPRDCTGREQPAMAHSFIPLCTTHLFAAIVADRRQPATAHTPACLVASAFVVGVRSGCNCREFLSASGDSCVGIAATTTRVGGDSIASAGVGPALASMLSAAGAVSIMSDSAAAKRSGSGLSRLATSITPPSLLVLGRR
jgi:hypothetical protein